MADQRTVSKPRDVCRILNFCNGEEERASGMRPWLTTSDSDTSQSDSNCKSPAPLARHRGYCSDSSPCKHLPPIGVFWDIENCQIPRGRSAVAVAQVIRDKFFDGYREAEFLVVCDVKKEPSQVVQELNDAQVNLIHVGSQCKNAADEKLRQSIRRFADLHGSLAAIVLISGDINFAPDLNDLRHRKKIHVILVHNDMCSESLMLCANERYRYSDLVGSLPLRGTFKSVYQPAEVTVSSLPHFSDPNKVRQRLKRLAENCGGRVGVVSGELATVRFPSFESATRAQKRMDGEKVFGSHINVSDPIVVSKEMSPSKGFYRRSYSKKDEDRTNVVMNKDQQIVFPIQDWINQGTPKFQNGCYVSSAQPPKMPFYNQENVPCQVSAPVQNSGAIFPVPSQVKRTQVSSAGRPILGRRNEPNHHQDPHAVHVCAGGRHSLDSLLDGGGEDKPFHIPFFLNNRTARCTNDRQKCRTSSPNPVKVNTSIPPPPIVNLPRKEAEYLFHPIPQPVELLVTNLDRSIDPTEMKKQLFEAFSQHCSVVSVSVSVQGNGSLSASVKVGSLQDAQQACAHLHRQKIGFTQIHVSLHQGHEHSPSPASSSEQGAIELYCAVHSSEASLSPALPCVSVRLAHLSGRFKALISSHDDRLPLASLLDCYAAQFEPLPTDEQGVPLEHLVTCVSGVQLVKTSGGRYLCLGSDLATDNEVAPADSPLARLGEELVELLRSQPGARVPFSRLVPAYRRHFGYHCRVSDFGHTKLLHLLEALPLVVQVVGEGSAREVTLAHRTQLNRFTQDLVLVLKPQANKQLSVRDLPSAWERTLGRVLEPKEYGLCHVDDLLSLVSPCSVTTMGQGLDRAVALPCKPQTALQKGRMREFATQVVELLSLEPHFSMEFSNFIPAYHKHFKTQCRVADFGFTKLIELFEAIPHVVQVVGEGGRRVRLTLEERTKVLASQVVALVLPRYPPGLALDSLNSAYLWEYGVALKPAAYDCLTLVDLLHKLPTVKVVTTAEGCRLVTPQDRSQATLLDRNQADLLRLRTLRVLWERSSGRMNLAEFQQTFQRYFHQPCSRLSLDTELKGVVTVTEDNHVQLSSLQLFARDVYRLLSDNEGRLALSVFEAKFREWVGVSLSPQRYGYPSILALILAVGHVAILCTRGNKRLIVLNNKLAEVGISLPSEMTKAQYNSDSETVVPPVTSPTLPNGLKPKTQQKCLTLLSPAQFLLPPTSNPLHPSSPDPSMLPKPGNFNLTKESVNGLFNNDYSQFGEDLNDQNKRKLRLAAMFQSPVQLK